MSFSSQVKSELSRHMGKGRHCRLAELLAIINTCGKIIINNNKVSIKIITENVTVARKTFTLLKKTFNIKIEVLIRKTVHFSKNRYYLISIPKSEDAKEVLFGIKLINKQDSNNILNKTIDPVIVQSTCCKRAYIRGCFLGAGSISDPEKTYHMEFVNVTKQNSYDLQQLMMEFSIDAKIIKRKKYYVVYIKDGTQIVNLLNIIEAHVALMHFENVRIVKEMRNNVNRIVNCETANLKKTVSAAVKQLQDINYIDDTIGIDKLPTNLAETARFRMLYTDCTLKELGMMLDPPVSKSGVNHRLRKISNIANKLRSEREDNNS